jgi:gas vesicle protein
MKNFIFGGITGGVSAIISHPLFNIKTTVQNGDKITKEMYSSVKWLYSGAKRTMIGYSLEKLVVFGVYNSLRKHEINPFFAGGVSGFLASLIVAPTEQMAIDKLKRVECYQIKHLYKSLYPTIFRESIGFSIHFTTYNFLSETINKEKNKGKTIICACCAVITGWGSILPIDRIKTQISTGTFVWKDYKILDSYRGAKWAFARALVFHTSCFLIIEELNLVYTKFNL